jgi:plasmid stabilization system protein ParE
VKEKYEIIWSQQAMSDVGSIADHLSADGEEAALIMLAKLEARAEKLHTLPHRGRVVPELLAIDVNGYRELVEPPYRILYRIAKDEVFIVAALDGRRDLASILLARLLAQ